MIRPGLWRRLRQLRPTDRPATVVGSVLVLLALTGTAASTDPHAAPQLVASAVHLVDAALAHTAPPPHAPAPAALPDVRRTDAAAPTAGVAATVPATVSVKVRRPSRLIQPDLLITRATGLSAPDRTDVRSHQGIRATLALATGPVHVAGSVASALSTDPASLRTWTPGPTARSDALWARIAAGELAASFDLSKNLHLPLGGQVAVRGRAGSPPMRLRLGALASLALPGLDLTVSPSRAAQLKLTPNSAMLVAAAPGTDLLKLRNTLRSDLGPGTDVQLLREAPIVRDAGSFLTRAQLATILGAAQSRIGAPYVWGATGPGTFDCSGLVGYAFHAAGIAMPRTSEQLWFAGPHVPSTDARAGDLLFWANDPAAPTDIDHVAIYLGGGMMISAPHTGDVVHIAPVYGANFRGVVRVDPAAAANVGGGMWRAGDPGPAQPLATKTP